MSKKLGHECLRISNPQQRVPDSNPELENLIKLFHSEFKKALQEAQFYITSDLEQINRQIEAAIKIALIQCLSQVSQTSKSTTNILPTITNNVRISIEILFRLAKLTTDLVSQDKATVSSKDKNIRISNILRNRENIRDIVRMAFTRAVNTSGLISNLGDKKGRFNPIYFELNGDTVTLSAEGLVRTTKHAVNYETYSGCPAARIKARNSQSTIAFEEAQKILDIIAEFWQPYR